MHLPGVRVKITMQRAKCQKISLALRAKSKRFARNQNASREKRFFAPLHIFSEIGGSIWSKTSFFDHFIFRSPGEFSEHGKKKFARAEKKTSLFFTLFFELFWKHFLRTFWKHLPIMKKNIFQKLFKKHRKFFARGEGARLLKSTTGGNDHKTKTNAPPRGW